MQAQIKILIPTQRRVLNVGKEMVTCSSAQGNLWQQVTSEVLNRQERSVISTGNLQQLGTKDIQNVQKLQKIQRFRSQKLNLATSFPYITRLCSSHGESSRSQEGFMIGNRRMI